MPDLTIKPQENNFPTNPNVVFVENHDGSTTFKGSPTVLRKIIFWVGDVVWPGWYENEQGKETYLGYANSCEAGELSLQDDKFLDIAWPTVSAHLEVDGIFVYVVPTPQKQEENND